MTGNGVRQGDNMSPVLFNVFLNDLVAELKELNLGVDVGNKKVGILLYADDIVLIADKEGDLQQMLDHLYTWCCNWRLSINTSKTQIVHFRNRRKDRTDFKFSFGENQLVVVENYKYLGIVLTEYLDYSQIAEVLSCAASRALGSIISRTKN